MNLETFTDEFIAQLRLVPKKVENPGARRTGKARHSGHNYDVVSDDRQHRFTLFVRQSTLIASSFSCGLRWHVPAGGEAMLARYNGSDHAHRNSIEGDVFDGVCHIHSATQRYASLNRKLEHFAEATTRYSDQEGALQCLLVDWNISGLRPAAGAFGEQSTFL